MLTFDGMRSSGERVQKTIEGNPAGVKLRISRHGQEQDVTLQAARNLKRS